MENENKLDLRLKLSYLFLFLFSGIVVFLFSFFLGKSYEIILRNTISSMILTGTVIFMMIFAYLRGKDEFSFDNYKHRYRFVVLYFAGITCACFFSLTPIWFWPYMSLFLMLGLFSNIETGFISGFSLVAISSLLLEGGDISTFFMYVCAGAVILVLFRYLDENTAVAYPVAIATMVQAILIMAFGVLFQNKTLSFRLLFLPFVNLTMNLIIILIFLNMFGVYIIRKSNDMYMEINDPEYQLLTSIKEKNKEEYYKAIHTAYLAEKIALGLSLNSRAIKAVSYYHRIGILEGKTKWEDICHFYTDHNFPVEAIDYLHEYIEPDRDKARSKETLSVKLCETVVVSIRNLINKDKDAKIDYDRLIDNIFDQKIKDGSLKEYGVTFREYEQMRKILKKEKLYYDFLR